MPNIAAFVPVKPETEYQPQSTVVRDRDGFIVPELWRSAIERWEALPKSSRQRSSEFDEAKLAAQATKKPKQAREFAPRFSTDAALKWGRKKGWKLIDRENYNHKVRRSHDLMLGMDLLFDTPDGMVAVQAAGKSERKEHYQRFLDRGGIETARRRHVAIIYAEFERGNPEPIKEERWA